MVQFSYLRAQIKAATPRAALTPDAELARAMLTPAMFVAMADGDMQPVEQREMLKIVAEDADVQRAATAGSDIAGMISTLKQDVQARDPEDLIEEAYELLTDARALRAISHALRIANADGDFDVEEQGTLMAMARNFGVSAEQVNGLLHDHGPAKGGTKG